MLPIILDAENNFSSILRQAEPQASQLHTLPFPKAHPGSSESLIHCLTKQPHKTISSKHRKEPFCVFSFFFISGVGMGCETMKEKVLGRLKRQTAFSLEFSEIDFF